jgi:hypothetical protein
MPIPLSVKLAMVVAFVVVMGGVAWTAHYLWYDWLPDSVVGYLAVLIIGLLAGYFIGEYSERRHIRKSRDHASPGWDE